METSYETICDAERIAPKKAYFELLDHPAIKMPKTPNEDIPKITKIAKSISDNKICSSKGRTIQNDKLNENVNNGASKKRTRFACVGNTDSFNNNFKPSAKGCKRPNNPTTLGPFLRCIAPKIFLSHKVTYATANNSGKATNNPERRISRIWIVIAPITSSVNMLLKYNSKQ